MGWTVSKIRRRVIKGKSLNALINIVLRVLSLWENWEYIMTEILNIAMYRKVIIGKSLIRLRNRTKWLERKI